MTNILKTERLKTDILIIGGGTAGCYAAVTIAEHSDAKVLICEKAHIKRSGTAKAMEMGDVEGAMSSLSIAVAGILTVVGASIYAMFI